jgi:drug/metabolite transporter (DMT)-like permease
VEGVVFAAVLAAAVLHASWNAIAKVLPDQRVAAGTLGLTGFVAGATGAAMLPAPDPSSWPYLATSTMLQAVYLLLLVHAYRHGEFGQVYPLARGLPPLLVALVSLVALGERLSAGQWLGVVVVSMALTALIFAGSRPRARAGLGLAAVTGLFIASYTVVDGVGVRLSGNPWSYAMWLFALHGPLVLAISGTLFGRGFSRAMVRSAPLGLTGGGLAVVTYALVLWAQSRAPLALVSTLRETSLLFAGVIGTLVLGERFSRARLAVTAVAVAGIALLHSG